MAASLIVLALAPAAARAVTPTDGARYAAGTSFSIPCISPTPLPDVHALNSWLYRADPRTPPHVYPAAYNGWDVEHPDKSTVAPWKLISSVGSNTYQALAPSPGAWTCNAQYTQSNGVVAPGATFQIWRPGYYHMLEFDVTEHHVPPPSTYPWPPDTASCSDDIGGSPYVSAIGFYNNGQTVVIGHCRHYTNVYFTVYAKGDCTDLTAPYVDAPYINQYDWGAHSKLPIDAYGARGGNACGSSSMSMLLFGAGGSPAGTAPKTSLYNDTAQNTPANGIKNGFDFYKAQAVAQSMGYKNANVVDLGGSVDRLGVASENNLSNYLKTGPVVTSTKFGAGDWSTAGDGHVILFLKKYAGLGAGESSGDYIADDPAGGFFEDPAAHYGPGMCGHLARYPVSWVAQLTFKRWALVLGKKVGPSADAARAGHTAVLLELPTGVSVWVQDRAGHKVGFVGANQTVGLSGISLNDQPQAPSDPRAPLSTRPLSPAPALVALDPGKGLTLVARGPRGRNVTAKMFVYRNGKQTSARTVRARLGAGTTRLLAVPSVPGGHNVPLKQLTLRATPGTGLFGLNISGRAPFAGFLKITVTNGSGTVGAGGASVPAGAFSVPVFLFPGTTGAVTVTATLTSPSGRRVTGTTSATV